jgi:hypothetical protein
VSSGGFLPDISSSTAVPMLETSRHAPPEDGGLEVEELFAEYTSATSPSRGGSFLPAIGKYG